MPSDQVVPTFGRGWRRRRSRAAACQLGACATSKSTRSAMWWASMAVLVMSPMTCMPTEVHMQHGMLAACWSQPLDPYHVSFEA